MEFLAAIIVALAAYSAGTQETKSKTPRVSEAQQCADMCEKGVVAQYKWCKCQTKALWDGGK